MSLALQIEGLRKSYGATVAIEQLDLEVKRGETVALLGPNGGGKTTVLRCIAGLLRPDAGRIRLFDEEGGWRARRRLGFVPQQASFARRSTVAEVMRLHAGLRGRTGESHVPALEQLGLRELEDRAVEELSVGMRQRLSLAVAMISEPDLLLLDEPTANLDPAAALRFRELAASWKAAGRSLLVSTHVLADAERLADRVVVLVAGKVVGHESVAAMRQRLVLLARNAPFGLDDVYLEYVKGASNVA